MEHIDIEKKIHEIRESLNQELNQANAIDEKGHATNEKMFDFIIDEKIKEIQELEPMITNEAGVTQNRYASNILMHHLELLNEMKKNRAIKYEPNLPEQDPALKNINKTSKKQIFANGISKLIKRITGRKKAMEYSR